MFAYLGLILIIVGWFMQLRHLRKNDELCVKFVALYSLGVLLLVVDGIWNGPWGLAALNLIALIVSMTVLKKIKGCCCYENAPAKPYKKKKGRR